MTKTIRETYFHRRHSRILFFRRFIVRRYPEPSETSVVVGLQIRLSPDGGSNMKPACTPSRVCRSELTAFQEGTRVGILPLRSMWSTSSKAMRCPVGVVEDDKCANCYQSRSAKAFLRPLRPPTSQHFAAPLEGQYPRWLTFKLRLMRLARRFSNTLSLTPVRRG